MPIKIVAFRNTDGDVYRWREHYVYSKEKFATVGMTKYREFVGIRWALENGYIPHEIESAGRTYKVKHYKPHQPSMFNR